MLTLLDTLIGFIAPHSCYGCGIEGALLCDSCRNLLPDVHPRCYRCHRASANAETCKQCRRASRIRTMQVATQYEGIGERLLHGLKFERKFAAGVLVGSLLPAPPKQNIVVCAVPTAPSRIRVRGYDQARIIARAYARRHNLPYRDLLHRDSNVRQTGSSRSQRTSQMRDVFTFRSRTQRPQNILLIDDVLTTGSTLEAAADCLRGAGVKEIHAIVFARAE